ncbi:MAG: hypothetical protein WCI06_02535 [Methylococcaceae bacterium]
MALLSQANYAQIPADSSMAFDATTTKSFGFTANANDALGGYLISQSGAVPMSYKIYDSSQTLVKSAESTGSVSQLNLIQFTFPKAGQYFIEVTGSSSVAMGLAVGKPGATPTYSATTPVFSGVVADIPTVGGFTQAQVDAQVTAARVGLFTQTEVTAQVTAAKVGLLTQAQVDSAITTAKVGLLTQTQVDSAVATALAGSVSQAHETSALAAQHAVDLAHEVAAVAAAKCVTPPPVIVSSGITTDPITLDKTVTATGVVTMYSASNSYDAISTNTQVNGNALPNTITANDNGNVIYGGAGDDTLNGGTLGDTR